MNKRIDFTNLGGYPLAQEDLDWLQTSYRAALAAIASMVGDKVIISGMVEAGGEVTAGWIAIGGELVPFAAGAIGTGEFTIQETATPLTFNDGLSKDVLFERIAIFSGGGAYQYSDLVRIGKLIEIAQPGDVKMVSCDAPYIAANFDVTGLGINKRTGWAICNGDNGTVDMGSKFPVGYKEGDADYGVVGNDGGEKEHTLTIAEMPSHKHKVSTTGDQAGVDPARSIQRADANGDVYSDGLGVQTFLESTGGDLPHENRPPYVTLLFIQKL